jgi:type VI protein secretion system component VasK
VSVSDTGGSTEIPPRTFSGQWGLFKMFEAGGGTRNKAGDNEYSLSWNVGSVNVRANLRPSSANNPFQRSLFTNMRAPQSLQK